MHLPLSLGVTVALSLVFLVCPTEGKIQSSNCQADTARANAVKSSFQNSFNDYLEYAKASDELLPLSKGRTGGFGNWGATYIDALTTAHIMGLDNIVDDGITFTKSVNFQNTSQTTISLFETNIRYLASCLSLYELTGGKDEGLIKQAKTIGDHLLKGWVGDRDLPYNSLENWNSFGAPDMSSGSIIAEGGTLLLEFSRLSKYTKDDTYLEHAEKAMKAIIKSNAVFPGLYGQGIDPNTNQRTDDYVTWSGGSDSFFEYLIKYGQLIGSRNTYIPTWIDSVKSSVRHLITHPGQTERNMTHMADYSNSNGGKIPRFSHLGCFVGGNWILGGKLLKSDPITDYGLQLASSCINTYTSSVTGIGPESYVFKTSTGGTNGVKIYHEDFYKQHGFDYESVDYVLRPEVLESVFYAYRATGERKWQDLAWNAFNNIKKYCKAPAALAGIQEVNNTQTAQFDDSESFLYAELYKYLYLIFDDPNSISLDAYVFNTEGHPFKLEKPNADYSSIQVGSLPNPTADKSASNNTPTQTSKMPLPVFSNVPDVQGLLQKIFDSISGGSQSGSKRDVDSKFKAHKRQGGMKRLLGGE